ncbi:hypothetical protein PRK78_000853 [Emydomyces testavorans]|uniref:Galactose oxidase n=1 Tax=Emydomyces testavorans TaxID=2070801 RepID=A0AAF0IG23_9EURO|nr:hypothetical protein PRK78_000853 [Emydomyces testavorans]
MVKALFAGALVQFFARLTQGSATNLPYNPSYLWAPTSSNVSLAYVLAPKSPGSNELRLQGLDISNPFDDSSPRFVDLTDETYFLSERGVKSIVPLPDTEGFPGVYVGDCRSRLGEVWRFVPGSKVLGGSGTWLRSLLKHGDGDDEIGLRGPNYLAGAIAFPDPQRKPLSDFYVFGGMCPQSEVDGNHWLSTANYSRTMISLRPMKSPDYASYEPSTLSIRSPPVAEAGFSMTPLLAAHSNSSSGRQLRQQSFALIGGHTQSAFINMSQIALFSLPESSWSYVSIKMPDSLSHADVKRKGAQGIEPRSGHTAVLAPDGDKVIVLGGWVGDITAPAQPQLAILHLGEDYGGSGEWAWTIPRASDNGLPYSNGIFGHGAAMLPGGIMAVVGGYDISRSSKRSLLKPRDKSQIYLFNVTSESWITSYTPPIKPDTTGVSSGLLSSPGQKAGLGVGLGVGVSAAIVGILFLFCARTRHKRAYRKTREQELRKLALGAERPHMSVDEMPAGLYQPMIQVSPRQATFNAPHNGPVTSTGYRSGWIDNASSIGERAGLLVETQSPTRELRKGMHSRTYQPAIYSEDGRRTPTFCNIHPIDEGEEYEENQPNDARQSGLEWTKRDSNGSIMSDPFKDPPSPVKACAWPSIIPSRNGDGTRMEWRQSIGPKEPMSANNNGQRTQSPDKTDRTLSNLSESSKSSMSTSSYKTVSMGHQAVTQVPTFRPRQTPPSPDTLYETTRNPSLQSQGRELPPQHLLNDGLAFTPQRSERIYIGGNQGQSETGSLLGGVPSSLLPSETNDPPSQNKSKALEWVGSVRRALSLVKKPENARTDSSCSDRAPRMERSMSSSPTKSFDTIQENVPTNSDASVKLPRRAVSTSSSVLRRKKGAKDWDVNRCSAEQSTLLRRESYVGKSFCDDRTGSGRGTDSPDLLNNHDDDEDWDVEAAAEGRVVQVTFTVPKEKLRVVNAGAEDELDDDDDDNDLKGRHSVRNTSLDTKDDSASHD